MAGPSFDITFKFRDKQRYALITAFRGNIYSVSFMGDMELVQDFQGIIFFRGNGKADYITGIRVSDRTDLEKAILEAIRNHNSEEGRWQK